jgi:hypothetical protein
MVDFQTHQVSLLYALPPIEPLLSRQSILASPYPSITSRNALITRFLVHAPATRLMHTEIACCGTSSTAPYDVGSERVRRRRWRSFLTFTLPYELRIQLAISDIYHV